MRKSFLILLITVLMLIWPSYNVQAGTQNFYLVNRTGVIIYNLYIAPSNSNSWEEDVLGDDILDNGESVHINFRNRYEKYWDIKIKDKAGNSLYWEYLNLNQITTLTLYYNGQKAWVNWE